MSAASPASANARGALAGLLAFGLFATHDALIKGLGETYAPFQIVFFSVLLSFPLTTLYLMRDTAEGNLIPRHPWWMAARTAAVVTTAVSAFYAFSVLPLAQVYAILFASPLVITMLSIPILGEAVGPRRWLAVGAGLLGVLVVLRPGGVELGLGHAAALVAAFGGAFGSVVVRRIGRDERPVVFLLYPMVANFVADGLPACPSSTSRCRWGTSRGSRRSRGWASARRWASCWPTAWARHRWWRPMQYSQIVWATLYGALFFGETPDAFTALGAAIVIGSGLYILFREGRVSKNAPVLSGRGRIETGITPRIGRVRHRGALPEPRGRAAGLDAVRRASLKAPPGRGGLANLRRPE